MATKNRNVARVRRHARVRKKIHGTQDVPRLNVFRSISDIYVQVIDDEAGKTLASASSIDRGLRGKSEGVPKVEQAKMVGKLIAERAREKGIEKVVFDRGGYQYFGRVQALADAAREAGLKF